MNFLQLKSKRWTECGLKNMGEIYMYPFNIPVILYPFTIEEK